MGNLNAHVAVFILQTLREHKRNTLKAVDIQARMDKLFDASEHVAIWRALLR
jgi:hypothetical protein